MLLIKEFDDYYDFGVGFGVDKKIVYKRRSEKYNLAEKSASIPERIISIRNKIDSFEKPGYWETPRLLSSRSFIGFCGVIYSIPRVDEEGKPSVYIWGKDDLPKKISESIVSIWGRKARNLTIGEWASKNNVVKTFECKDFFVENKLIAFVVDGDNITLNPNMSKLGLQKALPGLEAFQLLSMYLAEFNNDEKESVSGTDIDIRNAKGFDNMSFKKRP